MTLTSHYTKASGSETKKRKVRDAKVCNTNLNSPRRDDVGDGKLVSQLFVEAEMSVLAPFCEADPTGSLFLREDQSLINNKYHTSKLPFKTLFFGGRGNWKSLSL